jgi:Rrf2 family protein
MDLIRRNTDYAIRAMVYLAKNRQKEPISARQISDGQNISYGLVCKLLQRLKKNKLVKSSMGPKGGFCLNREPSEINLLKIIETIQGPVSLNRCLLNADFCKRKKNTNYYRYNLYIYFKKSLGIIKIKRFYYN